jgi:Amt family ammonium transporter
MMISAALVLLMTPGLAVFYAGMVRGKNVLSVLMQSFVAAGIVSILWVLVGYSLAFGPDHGGVIGDFSWAGLRGVSMYRPDPYGYAPTIPHLLHMVFQMTFAIITPALISGAVVERMKFSAYFLFICLWSLLVYCPMAHMIWAHGGALGTTGVVKAFDFAGGTTVEIASGFSAIVMAFVVGRRNAGPDEMRPHSLPLTMIGAALLWFGWFGFNAGSAGSAGPLAVNAFVATHLAAAGAATMWMTIEWVLYKKPSVLGFASGAVAGMVAITPAAGFVTPMVGLLIGVVAAIVAFYAIKIKARMGYDDSLDVFAVHGCAGFWGMLAVGLFAARSVNPAGGGNGWLNGDPAQFWRQLIAACTAVLVATIGTFLVAKLTSLLTGGLRASRDDEEFGLDVTEHGEAGYSNEESGAPAPA